MRSTVQSHPPAVSISILPLVPYIPESVDILHYHLVQITVISHLAYSNKHLTVLPAPFTLAFFNVFSNSRCTEPLKMQCRLCHLPAYNFLILLVSKQKSNLGMGFISFSVWPDPCAPSTYISSHPLPPQLKPHWSHGCALKPANIILLYVVEFTVSSAF